MNKKRPFSVLIIEDISEHVELLIEVLEASFAPVIVYAVDSFDRACDLLATESYHLILSDASVQDVSLVEQLHKLLKLSSGIPFIVVTGAGNERLAAKLIKAGINEYIVKTKESLESLPRIFQKYLSARKSPQKNKNSELGLSLEKSSPGHALRLELERISSGLNQLYTPSFEEHSIRKNKELDELLLALDRIKHILEI